MKQFFLNNNEIENVFRSKPLQYESKYTIDELIQRTFELNKITKNIDKGDSIAIVGNSGKLMNESYGKLIDSHDLVFRCNLAQTNGYEKHVGSNTDFRF